MTTIADILGMVDLGSDPSKLDGKVKAAVPEGSVDDTAVARIEAVREVLRQEGVKDTGKDAFKDGKQFYADGTRMMQSGYDLQAKRRAEYDAAPSIKDALAAKVQQVRAENRKDYIISGSELARTLAVNEKGAVTILGGFRMREQFMRGLMQRTESNALGYILSLRDRICGRISQVRAGKLDAALARESNAQDTGTMLEVLRRELTNHGAGKVRCRVQESLGYAFAALSTEYSESDMPRVADAVLSDMPEGTKGLVTYDPVSTSWEARALLFSPTPTAEMAVGEPFQGYVSISSSDNGTSRVWYAGGIECLRCMNASTYTLEDTKQGRVHRGRVLRDVTSQMQNARKSIDALAKAWGKARSEVVEMPDAIALDEVMPGMWEKMLKERQYGLYNILSGRTDVHAAQLAKTFQQERRDAEKVVKSDLAQAWTRYVQDQPDEVRRKAERAIGEFVVSNAIPTFGKV